MKKKIVILALHVILITVIICELDTDKIKREIYEYTTEDYLETPEWIDEIDRDMVDTNQQISIGDYNLKLVGKWQRDIHDKYQNKSEYLCKFEITNPNVDLKKCVIYKENTIMDGVCKAFGISDKDEYMAFEIPGRTMGMDMNTGNGITYYYKIEKDKLIEYVYLCSDAPICPAAGSIYIRNDASAGESFVNELYNRDMKGVFNYDISDNEKNYSYNNEARWNINITDYNVYFNGEGTEKIYNFVIHMKDGREIDVLDKCIEFDEYWRDDDYRYSESIYDMGTYEPNAYVKTYTRLIHFMAGTDVENIDYLEINGQILK